MLSCLPWPPSARPLHCGSFGAWGHDNELSEGTDGGLFGKRHKKGQGRRDVMSEQASNTTADTLEVKEGNKLNQDFRLS